MKRELFRDKKYIKFIQSGNIKKAKEHLLKTVPEDMLVYKYFRGINRDWNTIISNNLWMNQAIKFNDPYDCAFLYNHHSKETYDPQKEKDLAFEEYIKQIKQDKSSQNVQSSIFIFCFSEKCDSLLMWGHYADEHKGICIGYNLKNLIENYDCLPVIYNKQMPQIKDIDFNSPETLYECILTKSVDWKYEYEWRIIKIDKNSNGKSGNLIPFIEPDAIYMGTRSKNTSSHNHSCFEKLLKEEKTKGKEVYKNKNFYVDQNSIFEYARRENVLLFEFELNRKEFKLNRRTIKF